MINFDQLTGTSLSIDYSDLMAVFESLDRQTSHTELRPSQIESINELSSQKSEEDLILKVSTGAGKTAIGLLYLYSHMKAKKEPVVYLCPTTQLVDQVIEEAEKIGIKAVNYKRGEKSPGADAQHGESVIVCTYDKLFNAKSTFNRPDVMLRPCAIVLDDAHSGLEIIKRSFCLSLSSNAIKDLFSIIGTQCEQYKPSLWADIKNNDPLATMEIPFWIWKPAINDIISKLLPYRNDNNFIFVWPYMSDILHLSRCIASGRGVEIIPDLPPVHKCPAYTDAKHRLFMSATLADDSVLVRELECSTKAALQPIIPHSDKGLGERMVLAPSLVHNDLNRESVMELCSAISKHVKVVVLSPNEIAARQWEDVGAKIFMEDEFVAGIKGLKDQSSGINFAVFVQRYDGIDLPDSSCRILVIDGMPFGESVADVHDASLIASPGGARKKIIYRIEQGMGRAVRSHVDYAVVLLVGSELASFIAKGDVLSSMNKDTQNQLKLALELSKLMAKQRENTPRNVLWSTMLQCLNRDKGWKKFYKERVKDAKKKEFSPNEDGCNLAFAERRCFLLALANNFVEASAIFEKAIDDFVTNEKDKGIYLQRLATYTNNYDPAKALTIQQGAFYKNTSVNCPPAVLRRPLISGKADQGKIVCSWLKSYENPNGAIATLQELRGRLNYNNGYKKVEQALLDLACILGAEGSRPENEFNEGPDCLWLWSNLALVIEAKNENEKTLHKKDAGQLLLSIQWFNRNYPTREKYVPLIAAKISTPDRYTDYPDGTRVIPQTKANEIIDTLEGVINNLISQGSVFWTAQNIENLYQRYKLSSNLFISNFTVPLDRI